MTAWSYSSITLFDQCPKKYYHLRISKDIKEPESEQMVYGKELHLAAEEYIRDDKAIPPQFMYIKPMLDKLKAVPGEKLCEYKLGIKVIEGGKLAPCDFFDKQVWYRGIADLIILDKEKQEARVIDYKTGKSAQYADTKQLKLLAAAVFLHFPEIKTIKAGLLFVVANDFIRENYEAMFKLAYFEQIKPTVQQLESAIESNVWNPKRNFTCKGWCPVKECPHWEPKRNRNG
jgi:CRISPR/Cas system-associated exonuclease Cas4 (RecB family)